MTESTPRPIHPVASDHAGDNAPHPDQTPADDVGTTIDPADPLKRTGDDDMPGLDPVVPIIPSD